MSGILFNIVIDWVISELDSTVGFRLTGELMDLLTNLAFADDLVLIAESQADLCRQVALCVASLKRCGLSVNAAKCQSLAIVADGHTRQWAVDQSEFIEIDGLMVPFMSTEGVAEKYKYLGIQFGAKGTFLNVEARLERELEQTKKAPLKPEQRFFILKTNVLPAMSHQLVLAKTTSSNLRFLDRRVRRAVREWLHIPHSTPKAYFHSRTKDGGLGIPCFQFKVPCLEHRRLAKLTASQDRLVGVMVQSRWFQELVDRASKPILLGGFNMVGSNEESSCGWAVQLYETVDGQGLREAAASYRTQSWVSSGGPLISGRHYCAAIGLRGGLLSCKMRSTRRSNGEVLPRYCDCCGPGVQESLGHILQVCPRTHGPRSRRHNEVVKLLVQFLRRIGWNVLVEQSIPYSGTHAKPDILICREVPGHGIRSVCIDMTITSDGYGHATAAHFQKIAHYRDLRGRIRSEEDGAGYREGLVVSEWVKGWVRSVYGGEAQTEPEFSACAISWRGIFAPQSYTDLKALGLRYGDLTLLTLRTLEWGCWLHRFFTKSTTRRSRGRGVPDLFD